MKLKWNRKLAMIGLHILGWAIILLIPRYLMHQAQFKISLAKELTLWVPVMIVFYLNYYVLIPRLFTRRKFTLYAGVAIGLVVFSVFSIKIIDTLFPMYVPPVEWRAGGEREGILPGGEPKNEAEQKWWGVTEGSAMDRERMRMRMVRREFDSLILCILCIAVSTSIKVTEKWYSNEKERKEMENQKLTAELLFLKSQINPHFFFNTLNSIYSLAIQKSDKTPEAIVKLSEIMRYIIYESDRQVVPLKNELEYIKNYVELQKLRLMSNVVVSYTIRGLYNDILIEPLLFLPFIENAFKHGIDSTRKCEIKIKFVIQSDQLLFTVENPMVKQREKQYDEISGIGLANSTKRLELMYQDRHELTITKSEDFYKVHLAIKINGNKFSKIV